MTTNPEHSAAANAQPRHLPRPPRWKKLRVALRGTREVRPLAWGSMLAVFILVGALLFGLSGVQGLWAYHQLQRQESTLLQEVTALKQQRQQLLWRIQALTHDKDYLRHLVRERLGWAAPNEEVLLVPGASPIVSIPTP